MTKRYSLSLTWRVLLLVFLPLWLLSGAVISLQVHYLGEQQTAKLKDDLKLVARAIRAPIGEAINQGDMDTVRHTLNAVFSLGQIYGAAVYDRDGQRIAAAGIARRDNENEDNPLALHLVRTGRDRDAYQRQAGREVFSHFVPVTDTGGQITGLVEVTRKASDFSKSLNHLAYWSWSAWVALGLITLGIVLWGYRQAMGREVARLTQVMAAVGSGQKGLRAPQAGAPELRDIASAFNQMLDDMGKAEQAIAAHRQQEITLHSRLERQERMAALGRLVSGIAHELGAPLNVIDGRARRLARFDDDPQTQKELGAIRGQVARLTRIVRQLLDFGRSGIQYQQLRLKTLVDDVLDSVRFEQGGRMPQLQLDIPDAALITADSARLELALINLLRNSCQAGASRLSLAFSETAECWCLTLADDGPGLPPGVTAEQLLEPFFTTKPKGQGTGLGLAIVQNILADHGGDLTLLPQAQGLQFRLRFPKDHP
ncbi:ATP-binding protein [Gallaecimonas mangrovi]|uniref:ATP-binding protein n=1 Tax=Gallaecimonas mangrovi TaxID=2291597 RepID=UPI000E207F6E|nr:ATP-binding protein [Gallaecimonas mangrovi]